MRYDVAIIGAGASGLMCAYTAALRGKKVLLLEGSKEIGRKLAISGGGRCNFSNIDVKASHYYSQNPHFVRSAIARFTPFDITQLFNDNGIESIEEDDGKLFCKAGAKKVVRFFEKLLRDNGVRTITNSAVKEVSKKDGFLISTSIGAFVAEKLVIATGGLSYSSLGATDIGYKIAKQFGHKIVKPFPALVPLLWSAKDKASFGTLAGVSINTSARLGKRSFNGGFLFTHNGISGPLILNISLYWKEGEEIEIDIDPSRHFPKRFLKIVCTEKNMEVWKISPLAKDSFEKAEVTGGGISTDEISSKTMESKLCEGLYLTGEVLDVTGMLGGYNLHWAWASGHAAGTAI